MGKKQFLSVWKMSAEMGRRNSGCQEAQGNLLVGKGGLIYLWKDVSCRFPPLTQIANGVILTCER